MLKSFFDFIFDLPIIKIFKPFYQRHPDVIYYIFFGGLTTVIGIGTFSFFVYSCSFNEHIANTLSWVFAVTFAFFTNRIWVFNSPTKTVGEFFSQILSFFGGRLFSLGVEEVMIFVFITKLDFNKLLIKIIASVVVLVLNYIISKLIIFKKKPE